MSSIIATSSPSGRRPAEFLGHKQALDLGTPACDRQEQLPAGARKAKAGNAGAALYGGPAPVDPPWCRGDCTPAPDQSARVHVSPPRPVSAGDYPAVLEVVRVDAAGEPVDAPRIVVSGVDQEPMTLEQACAFAAALVAAAQDARRG